MNWWHSLIRAVSWQQYPRQNNASKHNVKILLRSLPWAKFIVLQLLHARICNMTGAESLSIWSREIQLSLHKQTNVSRYASHCTPWCNLAQAQRVVLAFHVVAAFTKCGNEQWHVNDNNNKTNRRRAVVIYERSVEKSNTTALIKAWNDSDTELRLFFVYTIE